MFTLEQATKAQREVDICSTTLSLTSVQNGGGLSKPRPDDFTAGKTATHCKGG